MAQARDVNAENISAADFLQPIVTCLYLAARSDFNRTLARTSQYTRAHTGVWLGGGNSWHGLQAVAC
jgi:hypothetical protein